MTIKQASTRHRSTEEVLGCNSGRFWKAMYVKSRLDGNITEHLRIWHNDVPNWKLSNWLYEWSSAMCDQIAETFDTVSGADESWLYQLVQHQVELAHTMNYCAEYQKFQKQWTPPSVM